MRSRNIKPGFFDNEYLAECDPLARILFIGLWCMADREGRLEDRPKRIRKQLLGYDNCDIDCLLNQLATSPNGDGDPPFIVRYEVAGRRYIQITNFLKHQNAHVKEPESVIPIPPPCNSIARIEPVPDEHHTCTIQAPDEHHTCTIQAPDEHGSGPADSLLLIPDSLLLIPDSPMLNVCSEPSRASDPPAAKPSGDVSAGDEQIADEPAAAKCSANGDFVIGIPTNRFDKLGETFGVTQAMVDELQELYPAVDVMQQLKAIRGWNLANPQKRKTRNGVLRHINAWMAKEQNHGNGNCRSPTNREPPGASTQPQLVSDITRRNMAVIQRARELEQERASNER